MVLALGALFFAPPAAARPDAPPEELAVTRVKCTKTGTAKKNRLVGTNRRDVICARGGNDTVLGRGGGDRLLGEGGNDRVDGQGGADTLIGGPGNDRLSGGGGNDVLNAVDGTRYVDRVVCGAGVDTVSGDATDVFAADCERTPTPPPTPSANANPTAMALSNASVAEHLPAGTLVGTLSTVDPDPGDAHSYALVPGTGSEDNGSFVLDGAALKTAQPFDFETKSAYTIRVRTSDGRGGSFEQVFAIAITDAALDNAAPTDITLSSTAVAENQPPLSDVGTLSTTDADSGDTHTYALVAGPGDGDNGSFHVDGATLHAMPTLDYEAKNSYSIRIQTSDGLSPPYSKSFTISVTDVPEAPTNLALSSQTIAENLGPNAAVGTLTTTDPDAGDTHTYSLVAGAGDADNTAFQIAASSLQAKSSLNFEEKSSYSVRIRTDDGDGGTFDRQFTISVQDVNDPPVAGVESYGGVIGNTKAALGVAVAGEPVVNLTGNALTANDTDEDAGDVVTAIAETVSSVGGGAVAINANGTFTFVPGVGDKNFADSFTYRITDGAAIVSRVVNVNVLNELVWYVNSVAPAGGDGRSASPANSVANLRGPGGAGDADTTGDIIFLYAGTYAGGLPLEINQKLFGHVHGLTVAGTSLVPIGASRPTLSGGLVLANGNEVQGIRLGDAVGPALSGTSFGNATLGTVSPLIVSNGTGKAIDLNAGIPNATFVSTDGAGVTLTNVGGSVNLGNGTLSNAAGAELDVNGGSAALSYAGAIQNSGGLAVDIRNRTGGVVTLSGPVSTTGSAGGISLTNTGPGAVTFSGALTLSTGANRAFGATGGGTVNVTGTSNTLITTTGPALVVQNTNIGAGGLHFSAISSNGAPSGIVLENTGTAAGLTVSGGTIDNSTGTGIVLTNTRGATLSAVTVSNSALDNIRLSQAAGSATLSLTGTTVGPNAVATGNNGITLAGTGTGNVTLSVSGSTFTGNQGAGVLSSFTDSSAHTVDIGTSSFIGNNMAVQLATTEDADLTLDIHDNGSFHQQRTSVIQILAGAGSTPNSLLRGHIRNNLIGHPSHLAVDSGARDLFGIAIEVNDDADAVLAITGNNVQHPDQDGIFVQTRDSDTTDPTDTATARLDLTLRDNRVLFVDNNAVPPATAVYGTRVEARHATTVCLDIARNESMFSGAATGFRMRQRDSSVFMLERYTQSGVDMIAVQNFLAAQNVPFSTASATADSGTGFAGVADGACRNP